MEETKHKEWAKVCGMNSPSSRNALSRPEYGICIECDLWRELRRDGPCSGDMILRDMVGLSPGDVRQLSEPEGDAVVESAIELVSHITLRY